MNFKVLAAIVVALAVALALPAASAQTPHPGAAAGAAATAGAEEPKKPLSRKDARELKANADARLCLEFPTTLMIVKCAEKYRPDKHES